MGSLRSWWNNSSRLLVLRELPRLHRGLAALYLGASLVAAVVPTVQILAIGILVGRVPPVVATGADSAEARGAFLALALVAGLAVVSYLVNAAGGVAGGHLARIGSRRYDQELMEAVSASPRISHLEDPEFLDRLEAAAGRTRQGPESAVAVMGGLVTIILAGIGAAALVARFSMPLAVGLFVVSLLIRHQSKRRYDRITAALFDQGNMHRRSTYLRELATTPPAAKELRIFGLARWIEDRFHGEWAVAMGPVWGRMRKGWATSIALRTSWFGLLGVGGYLVVDAALSGRIPLAMTVSTFQAMLGMQNLSISGDADFMVAEGADRLREHKAVVAEARALAEQAAGPAIALPIGPRAPDREIRFEQVTFAYPRTSTTILRDFDLTIRAGTSIAIVGVNGAGKTTLVKLLAGLHRPTAGRITIDDLPLDQHDQHLWQKRVAAIFQDFWHYPLTVRENVGFGAPERMSEDAALERAAQRAGADEIIASLPKRWDTVLDRQFDDGVELSGGQWQRIALARALFAVEAGARVLVLDEPTAALDVRAEADIYDRFLDLTSGLTSIVISHRFSTVRRADRIVVIDDGRIIEDGTHEELLALDGRYARMFALQAARYRDPHEEPPVGATSDAGEGA